MPKYEVDYTHNAIRGCVKMNILGLAKALADEKDEACVLEDLGHGQQSGSEMDPTRYKVVYRHPAEAKCWVDFIKE